MSSFIPYQPIVGFAFSLTGLILSPLVSYFHRDYSRSLLIVQMIYLFSNVYASGVKLFANNLGLSWFNFMPSILTYCDGSSYQCNNANLLTPLIVWTSFILLVWIIIKLVSIKKPNANFQPLYTFFKGLFRWTVIPLFYNTITVFQQSLQTQEYHRDYYASLILLIFYGLVLLIQLIGYKCSQQQHDDSWKKWIELWNQIKIGCCLMLVSVSYVVNPAIKYVLYAPIILYDIFHLIKYNYSYKFFQRAVFLIQQAAFITIYSLFIFDSAHIGQYNLDFFTIALTIGLQLFVLIIRIYSHCKNNGKESHVKNQAIDTPQQKKAALKQQKQVLSPLKKSKSNAILADVNLDDSLAQLKGSISSPRKDRRGK